MWKKFLIPFVTLSLTAVVAGDYKVPANPSKVFVGAEVGYAVVQGTQGADPDAKNGGLAYGFRLGAQNIEWRTMLTLDHFNAADDNASYTRGELHADYLFRMESGASMGVGIIPFIGLNVGYASYKAKGDINASGVTYGGEAGVIFDVSESIDVDLMYQYSMSSADELDYISGIKIGLNYKY